MVEEVRGDNLHWWVQGTMYSTIELHLISLSQHVAFISEFTFVYISCHTKYSVASLTI